MKFERGAGILLHPTSLPGKYGIGDLGNDAYKFVDFLERAGQKLWQVFRLVQRVMVILRINAFLLLPEIQISSVRIN
mgnify:CR=1 FL=1